MAKSRLIKDFVNGDASVETTLHRMMVIAYDINDKQLLSWIKGELMGYKDSDELPEYRKGTISSLKYSGFNGRVQMKKVPMPYSWISNEYIEDITKVHFYESIGTLCSMINVDEFGLGRDLTFLAGDVFENTGIQCTSITGYCSISNVEDIISVVKTRIIQILLELERKYGSLDDLDIQDDSITSEESNGINFIFNDKSINADNGSIVDVIDSSSKGKIVKKNKYNIPGVESKFLWPVLAGIATGIIMLLINNWTELISLLFK